MSANTHHARAKHAQRLREEAARWFVRMRDSEPDHPDRGRFEAWLMGNPAHAREYSAIASVWTDLDSTRQLQSLAQAMEHRQTEAITVKTQLRKRIGQNLLTILVVFMSSLVGLQVWKDWASQPIYQASSSTGIGQIGRQTLVDGTKLVLNANTQVKIAYYRDRRTVDINQGEVIFDVTKDPSRPFIVDSGHARVTVLGTRFAVNRLSDLVRVSVDHGRVRVEAQDQQKHVREPHVVLHDGEVAEINEGGVPYLVQRNAQESFTFQQGVLTFRQARLSEIAETLSRYRALPVTASNLHQSSMQVTAVVQVADMENFIKALPRIAPVSLQQLDGQTKLIDVSRRQ
jgi:transmembrane sensor